MEERLIPARVGISAVAFYYKSTFLLLYLDLASKQIFPVKEKVEIGRTKVPNNEHFLSSVENNQSVPF